jgi:hypothetical protein
LRTKMTNLTPDGKVNQIYFWLYCSFPVAS